MTHSAKNHHFVYIAIDLMGNVYGGKSRNLSNRMGVHRRNGKQVIAVMQVEPSEMDSVEYNLIHFLCIQAREEEFSCTNKLLVI